LICVTGDVVVVDVTTSVGDDAVLGDVVVVDSVVVDSAVVDSAVVDSEVLDSEILDSEVLGSEVLDPVKVSSDSEFSALHSFSSEPSKHWFTPSQTPSKLTQAPYLHLNA